MNPYRQAVLAGHFPFLTQIPSTQQGNPVNLADVREINIQSCTNQILDERVSSEANAQTSLYAIEYSAEEPLGFKIVSLDERLPDGSTPTIGEKLFTMHEVVPNFLLRSQPGLVWTLYIVTPETVQGYHKVKLDQERQLLHDQLRGLPNYKIGTTHTQPPHRTPIESPGPHTPVAQPSAVALPFSAAHP